MSKSRNPSENATTGFPTLSYISTGETPTPPPPTPLIEWYEYCDCMPEIYIDSKQTNLLCFNNGHLININ